MGAALRCRTGGGDGAVKELLHRLSALDEDASAALKIITFFDALLGQRAGLEPFVRGAAVLAGCPAGFAHPLHHIWLRVDAEGHALAPVQDVAVARSWPHQELADGSGGVVWLERPSGEAAHDAVLLERLATCLHLTIERVSPLDLDDAGAIELLLSATSTDDARRKAARRLRLRDDARVRVVALGPAGVADVPRSAVVSTPFGPVRASIVRADEPWDAPWHGVSAVTGIAGVPRGWDEALLALRVASRLVPRVRWEDLGALTALGRADVRAGDHHPDVSAVAGAAREPWGLDTLEALSMTESVRAAAQVLGLHHSTVQARQQHLEDLLGFRVGTAPGRVRVATALVLHRLMTTRFDDQT
ncbi:CdaR family transcriptional regulator [Cellulomonas bogoriensis 69B4 = DSM 16987]|uniref:CdaR family transcriptional regulator n=1 Tax=Cellulomonas bogoriensis 69B4 = DSM 16987 TaxID=1386082 RepID=A0A0A0C2W5_9CELL|nr:CdaR family transcriptional regulator [Cellulomonas bogoriensis 69B4 = DSM 16987]